ncbi:SMI1/KNR4 family protein [Kitasatospora sp. NPDC004240]
MSEFLARLIDLCPPDEAPGAAVSWEALEARLGFRLPADYKELVGRYGPGSFDEFLSVVQPESAYRSLDLEAQIESARSSLRSMAKANEGVEGWPPRHPVESLTPVCRTESGQIVYWVRECPDEPDTWTIAVNESRGIRFEYFDGGVVEFLVKVLSGEFGVSFFVEFPGEEPEFESF